MPRAEKIYRRLPGRGTGLGGYHRLWLGPDHLLSVRATGYSEEYKRFYFRDIQAIQTRRTDSWLIGNVIFGILACVLSLVAAGQYDISWRTFWFSVSGVFFVFLLMNWAKGPTCICHIRTAVQTEQLLTLNRVRLARKVIGRLRPIIEGAQGPLPPELFRPGPPSPPTGSQPGPTLPPSLAAPPSAGQ